jgi:hypothetical protein
VSVRGDTASGLAPGHGFVVERSSTPAAGLHRAGKCNHPDNSTRASNRATCLSLADEPGAARDAAVGTGGLEDDVG